MLLDENLVNSKEIKNIEYNYFNHSVKVYYKSGMVEEYANVPEKIFTNLCEDRKMISSLNQFDKIELINE
ncbi:KTSC domain-containing protein [uncultured Methanobrevibacter sp.]|uniref:KTSC domain-containing protein n=1 Tax=uncultured Methanobrevibacter sp. TaxID=253161 RepID=UPI0025F025BA|nr:KTSC domain-containing protein [uncultured Methanobrevibacter sp.]